MENGVDALGRPREVVLVGDVAEHGLQPRMRRQWGRCTVERAHLVAAIQQLGYQVGSDEPGTPGDQNVSQFGGQRRITHAGDAN